MAVLLLVEIFSGKVHTKFTDAREPLADGIRGSMTLLAYRYPSSAFGPASGGKELHVFQRQGHLLNVSVTALESASQRQQLAMPP